MKRYAGFFEWFDQRRKELDVVEELLESLNRCGANLSAPRLHTPDLPDCVSRFKREHRSAPPSRLGGVRHHSGQKQPNHSLPVDLDVFFGAAIGN
jgi:hypothetical protein